MRKSFQDHATATLSSQQSHEPQLKNMSQKLSLLLIRKQTQENQLQLLQTHKENDIAEVKLAIVRALGVGNLQQMSQREI
jgi:hypothetical protein